MMIPKTAVMLIGFGGPRSPEETRPFLEHVLQGVKIPKERFEEVLHHYDVLGGVSSYIQYTEKQKNDLATCLDNQGLKIPVYAGYRHSKPFFKDIFAELAREKFQKVIGFVLSPLRSYSSFGKYVDRIEEAKNEGGAQEVEISYTAPFYLNPLFIEAQADRVKDTLALIPNEDHPRTFFIFSAHSIPVPAASDSHYAEEFYETAKLICHRLKIENWMIAYQSRSGSPRDPWLGPSVEEAMEKINSNAFKNVLVVPSGFLCDNVEVLFDLDIQAKEKAGELSLNYFRAKTVMDHSKFIQMMAQQVLTNLKEL